MTLLNFLSQIPTYFDNIKEKLQQDDEALSTDVEEMNTFLGLLIIADKQI